MVKISNTLCTIWTLISQVYLYYTTILQYNSNFEGNLCQIYYKNTASILLSFQSRSIKSMKEIYVPQIIWGQLNDGNLYISYRFDIQKVNERLQCPPIKCQNNHHDNKLFTDHLYRFLLMINYFGLCLFLFHYLFIYLFECLIIFQLNNLKFFIYTKQNCCMLLLKALLR